MTRPEEIAAIILAAGYSSRMGKFKPLLKLGRYTAIEHAVRCFFRAGVYDVRIVTGHRAEDIEEAVRPMGVRTIYNARHDEGMYSSVQAGVRSLEGVRSFFLLPADHPLVRASTVQKLLECRDICQKGILYPAYQGRRGHPPLISARYADKIICESYREGLQGLLSAYDQDSFDVVVPDEAVLLDMDRPEDYRALLGYLDSRAIPAREDCLGILRDAGVSEPVREHCHRVSELALWLVRNLNTAGAGLDEDLVLAGALLHDVAREQPDHALSGAVLLKNLGYPLVAEVVAVHMDIESSGEGPVSEAEVVFLADKMVRGCHIIPLAERFAAMREAYRDDLPASRSIRRRQRQAEVIKNKMEKIMGRPVEAALPEVYGALPVKNNSAEVEAHA